MADYVQEEHTQDFISQSVQLSAEAIYQYYVRVLDAATIFDMTDVEIVSNIQKLSNVAKSLVYAHATLCDYAKVDTVKAAIKTLNGVREYFQEAESDELAQEVKQQCQDTLIDYLQTVSRDDQLDLFDL